MSDNVSVTVSWANGSTVPDTWDLEGDYISTGDNEGVIHVHTTEESLFINASQMASVHVLGAEVE